jgi:hypothetical protein
VPFCGAAPTAARPASSRGTRPSAKAVRDADSASIGGEADYFIGAYLLNLVAVELLFAVILGVIFVATYPDTPWALLQWGGLVLMIGGAVLCYPFAKSVWLAMDLIFRPLSPAELEWHRRGGTSDEPGELPHL